jgi:excisionase family DNA binding protein
MNVERIVTGRTFINGRSHVTSADAARDVGLSRDYLSKLAKAGKIPSHRLGSIWLLDCQAVQSFIDEKKRLRTQRRAELSRMRVKEYRALARTREEKHNQVKKQALGVRA